MHMAVRKILENVSPVFLTIYWVQSFIFLVYVVHLNDVINHVTTYCTVFYSTSRDDTQSVITFISVIIPYVNLRALGNVCSILHSYLCLVSVYRMLL